MTLLSARGVTRSFGSHVALHPVDVELAAGEVVALDRQHREALASGCTEGDGMRLTR